MAVDPTVRAYLERGYRLVRTAEPIVWLEGRPEEMPLAEAKGYAMIPLPGGGAYYVREDECTVYVHEAGRRIIASTDPEPKEEA